MIVIHRGLCRAFPALARKCVSGRPRGPAPAVAFEVKAGTLTAWTTTGGAALVHAAPAREADGEVVVPMAALAAAGRGRGGPVGLSAGPAPSGELMVRFAATSERALRDGVRRLARE